jgi:hypothetical protein
MKTKDIFKHTDKIEVYLKAAVILVFMGWNVVEGAVFQNEYPPIFVKLYTTPIWRLILLIAVLVGAQWDHSVGIMLAFTIFFYVLDMEVTMEKWK